MKLLFYFVMITAAIMSLSCQPVNKSPLSQQSNLSRQDMLCEYLKKLPAVKDAVIWQNDSADGVLITTSHYSIYTTWLDMLMLGQIPPFLESAHKAYQKQLP